MTRHALTPDAGDALAAAVRAEIAKLSLGQVLTAQYLPEQDMIRLHFSHSGATLDYRVTAEAGEQLLTQVHTYARHRHAGVTRRWGRGAP